MAKKLFKSLKNKKICGVCGGLAEYFNIDATVVRIIVILLSLFSIGTGVIVYFIVALIMPECEKYSSDEYVDNLKSANVNTEGKSTVNEEQSTGKTHSDEEFNSYFKK